MKIWISVDMEGISGVMHKDHTGPAGREYEIARVWMTDEVNAVVEGAFAGGAKEILVTEGHGNCRNLIRDQLDSRVRLIAGQYSSLPPTMVEGVEEGHDAAMLVGYHARAGLAPGNLDHTLWSQTVTDVNVNGVSVGEAELNAAYAGVYGVPTVMVTGDDVLAGEIEKNVPGALAVPVKKARGRFKSEIVSRPEVHQILRAGAEQATKNAKQVKPFAFGSPITLRVTFTHPGMTEHASWVPGCEQVSPYVAEFKSNDWLSAFNAFTLMCATTGVAFYQQK